MSKNILIPDARKKLSDSTHEVLKNHYWDVSACVDSISKALFSYNTGIGKDITSVKIRISKMSEMLSELRSIKSEDLRVID